MNCRTRYLMQSFVNKSVSFVNSVDSSCWSLADAIVERLRAEFPKLEYIRVVSQALRSLAALLDEAAVELRWCSEAWPNSLASS